MRAPGLVSILLVAYDHAQEIDACRDGAVAQPVEGLDVEVVVARNASRDATVGRVRAQAFADERLGLPAGPPPLTPMAGRGARR